MAAAALLAPAAASAATVSAENGRITIAAKPGETNKMTVNEGDGSYQVTESGGSIEAGPGCTKAPNAERVGCPAAGTSLLQADLGDGDDTLTVAAGLTTEIEGGAGNDTIVGGFGDDLIRGGEGADGLEGNTGNDTLISAGGNDFLTGGAGDDSLQGGAGNDNLNGSEGNDTLTGADGRDTIAGGDGNDRIEAGNGADGLDGGAGDDVLLTAEGEFTGTRETRIRCGDGADVLTAGPADPFVSDCERTDGASIRLRKKRIVPLVLACAQAADCEGSVRVRDAKGRFKAGAKFDVPAQLTRTVAVKLTPAQAARLFKLKKVRLTATFRLDSGQRTRATFTLLRRV